MLLCCLLAHGCRHSASRLALEYQGIGSRVTSRLSPMSLVGVDTCMLMAGQQLL